jgi:hypothetical protein
VPSQKTIIRLKMAEEAAAAGITPLEVMLRTMRELWELGTEEGRKQACKIAQAMLLHHPSAPDCG